MSGEKTPKPVAAAAALGLLFLSCGFASGGMQGAPCAPPAFEDVTGAAADSQIPNNITIDLASTATALAAACNNTACLVDITCTLVTDSSPQNLVVKAQLETGTSDAPVKAGSYYTMVSN